MLKKHAFLTNFKTVWGFQLMRFDRTFDRSLTVTLFFLIYGFWKRRKIKRKKWYFCILKYFQMGGVKSELQDKQNEFAKLYLTGKYTQREIAEILGVSTVTICKWVKDTPAGYYAKTRVNLAKQLELISRNPDGKEELIFKYIEMLSLLDGMIRKCK